MLLLLLLVQMWLISSAEQFSHLFPKLHLSSQLTFLLIVYWPSLFPSHSLVDDFVLTLSSFFHFPMTSQKKQNKQKSLFDHFSFTNQMANLSKQNAPSLLD